MNRVLLVASALALYVAITYPEDVRNYGNEMVVDMCIERIKDKMSIWR